MVMLRLNIDSKLNFKETTTGKRIENLFFFFYFEVFVSFIFKEFRLFDSVYQRRRLKHWMCERGGRRISIILVGKGSVD